MGKLDVMAFMDMKFGNAPGTFRKMVNSGHVIFRRKTRAQLDQWRALAGDVSAALQGIDDKEEPLARSTKDADLVIVDVGPLASIDMCSTCESDRSLHVWGGSFRRYGVLVPARGRRCLVCQDTHVDAAMMRTQEKLVGRTFASRGLKRGSNFKLVRRIAGLGLGEVAKLCGASANTVRAWEMGMCRVPTKAADLLAEIVLAASRPSFD